MIIEFNNTAKIERLVEDQATGTKSYQEVVAETIPVYIEPLDEEVLQGYDYGAWYGYKLMTDFLDIKIGDRITLENGENLIVRGRKEYHNIIGSHLEANILQKYD